MRAPVRVIVVGAGQMGLAIARLVREKAGLELVGICVGAGMQREQRADALQSEFGCRAEAEVAALVEATRPDVAIQATRSRLDEVVAHVDTLVARGVHVISIAEEMAWPRACSPEQADRLDALARANGVGVLGTGINPGFVLDLLIIALTGVCARVESIRGERVNDLSPYGPSVLRAQGVGLTAEAFYEGVEAGTIVGHAGFPQSIGMIANAVGWKIERIEETREPILSQKRRQTGFVTVEPGRVAGCLQTAVAYCEGRAVIELVHPQQVQPQLEGVETKDRIEIRGTPDVQLEGRPEIPGGTATAALAVNMIPRLLAARPGLQSMADLPVPAAMLGDVRSLLGSQPGAQHG